MPDTFNKSTHYFAKNEVRLRSHFCVNCCFPVWPWLLLRRFNLSNIGDCVREGQVMLKITLTLTYTRPPMFDRLERRNNSYSVPVSRVTSGTGSRCNQRQSLASRGPKRVLRGTWRVSNPRRRRRGVRGAVGRDAEGVEASASRGWGMGRGIPLPSRLGGLWERRKIPQRGSPGGKRFYCFQSCQNASCCNVC